MKKARKKDFTKLTQKRGLSLIVLIVTIIVVIILAAAVILTIGKNNPVESAREAKFKEDVRSFQDDLALTISKEYITLQGQRNTKINAKGYSKDSSNEEEYNNSVYKYIPSFTKEYEGKLVIQNDELVYVENKVTEKEKACLTDLGLGIKVKTAAEKVAENPAEYYGQKITNYSANGIEDWKIFYADENNVYIITSDYLEPTLLPKKYGISLKGSYFPKAAYFIINILKNYKGSADITDEKIKALNNDYFSKGYISSYNNMKAVAYMLDTNIWSIFATDKAEYVVGGPTLEMFIESYKKIHGEDYRARASSSIGYQISKDGGVNWSDYYSYYSSKLNTSDSLYVLPSSNGAHEMWLASPSAYNSIYIMGVSYDGAVNPHSYSEFTLGFRPLVCLKSNITLKAVEGGYEIQ